MFASALSHACRTVALPGALCLLAAISPAICTTPACCTMPACRNTACVLHNRLLAALCMYYTLESQLMCSCNILCDIPPSRMQEVTIHGIFNTLTVCASLLPVQCVWPINIFLPLSSISVLLSVWPARHLPASWTSHWPRIKCYDLLTVSFALAVCLISKFILNNHLFTFFCIQPPLRFAVLQQLALYP